MDEDINEGEDPSINISIDKSNINRHITYRPMHAKSCRLINLTTNYPLIITYHCRKGQNVRNICRTLNYLEHNQPCLIVKTLGSRSKLLYEFQKTRRISKMYNAKGMTMFNKFLQIILFVLYVEGL